MEKKRKEKTNGDLELRIMRRSETNLVHGLKVRFARESLLVEHFDQSRGDFVITNNMREQSAK